MCLKEVMEKVTGKTYEQLVEDYITSKLKLSDTHLIVPEHKRELVTGTPNAHLGKNNDMKAIKLGGYSGHSGIMTNSDNLIKVVKNLYTNRHFFPLEHLSDVYTESEGSIYDDYCRGIMGNACTAGGSFVGKYAPLSTSSYQGSTRTQATTGVYNGVPVSSTILLNPCSMRLQKAQEFEEKIGRKIITEYGYYGKNYTQVASQVIIPTKVVKSLNDKMSEVSLKLAFLTTLINSTEKEYQGAIDIEMENRTLVKKI